MSHTIELKDLIQTFRAAAADARNAAGQTIDADDHDAIKIEEASHHAYADALADGEMLQIITPGGHEIGRVTPSKDRHERAEAAAKAFVQAVCSMDHSHTGFASVIAGLHRTHQQSVMRAMYAVMMVLAECQHDMRNEATVKFCKRATEGDNIFPFI